MIKIRRGLFETNSSSVHTLCIAKSNDYKIPEHLTFHYDEFGWETRFLYGGELADYLYTLGMNYSPDPEEFKNWLYGTLGKHGCECDFQEHSGGFWDYGYIDHGYEAIDWLDSIRHSEKKLLRFLFSPDSFILTGNDNGCEFRDILEDIDLSKVEVYKKEN